MRNYINLGKEITHCFAICAYKDSPYLENCIRSIVNQSVPSKVILTTSTPSAYIEDLAKKYGIPYLVREGASDIQDDWNFAYDHADADYVTVTHQDDEYEREYAAELMRAVKRYSDISLFITDYLPIKNGQVRSDINSRIKRIMRMPLKVPMWANKRVVKKGILCLGNCICCPSVTYNKKMLGETIFTSEYKYNLDWDTFYKYACKSGRFYYADKPLIHFRVHDGATSKQFIEDHRRIKDDVAMFEKFWPKFMVKVIMVFYKLSYRTYD